MLEKKKINFDALDDVTGGSAVGPGGKPVGPGGRDITPAPAWEQIIGKIIVKDGESWKIYNVEVCVTDADASILNLSRVTDQLSGSITYEEYRETYQYTVQ